VHKCKQHELI